MKHLYILCFLFSVTFVFAQIENSEDAVFEVEFEKFKPSNQDQIRSFEGKKPMQFLAPDINGEEQFLGSFKGKTVLIYFFNKDCSLCEEQIGTLNLLKDEHNGKLEVIAIGDESKDDLKKYAEEQGIQYTVLYNGKMLGEAAYGIEMGYPRVFMVDKSGITRHVLPAEAFTDSSKSYITLNNLYKLVNAK